MTKSESNKLSMLEATNAVLSQNSSKFASHSVLTSLSAELASLIANIKTKDAELQQVFAGKTRAKDDAKEDLLDLLLPAAKTLYVYGKRNGNEELKSVCGINRSELIRMRENDLVIKANIINDLLNANKASLTGFAVTDETIANLSGKITLFQNSGSEQDAGLANRVAARGALEKLFDDADELLNDEIDGLMSAYANTDKDFYNAYKSARVIKDLSYRKTVNEEPAQPAK